MGRILAVVNQKGGVGKTTTAINLASSLALAGKRVLLVDCDPQGNATSRVGVDKTSVGRCVYNMLIEDTPAEQILVPTQVPGLDLLPATIDLAGAEIELVAALSRESKMKYQLGEIKDRYDYLLIDSPPSLGLLTLNSLTASEGVLVPIQCEYYALEGISQLLNTIQLVRRNLNKTLEIFGVILTMYDPRTNLAQQVVAEVREYFKEIAFKTIVPRNIRLGEAPSHGLPISLYDPRSKGAEAYEELAREVIERG
jgi:chromosome partitioning protein